MLALAAKLLIIAGDSPTAPAATANTQCTGTQGQGTMHEQGLGTTRACMLAQMSMHMMRSIC
jgi:hypothetical protein